MSDLSKMSNDELAVEVLHIESDYSRLYGTLTRRACALREAASRLQAPAVAEVEVKPLEWKKSLFCETVTSASTIIGRYTFWTHHEAKGVWFWSLREGAIFAEDEGASAAEVQAAADADYERRVRACLRTGGSE